MNSFLERPPGMKSIKDKCPGPILRDHLKLGNNLKIFNEIQEKLRAKCRKYMALDRRPAAQEQALEKIKGELKAEQPDLFSDDDEAIYLALKTVMKYHYNRRVQERERVAKLVKEKKKSKNGKMRMQSRTPAIEDMDDKENTLEILSASQSPSASFLRSGSSRPSSTQSSGVTSSSQSSKASLSTQSSSILSSHRSKTRIPVSTSDGSGGVANDSIYAFLANCVPSMVHLYPLFINFGCNSEEYLLGVSTWEPDAIEKFLRQVANQAPMVDADIRMGEMDLLILQNHFRGYFMV